ncbi:hypothetical protein D3C77_601640 [compost metagenome]
MFENDYLLAWAIYAIAALGLLLVWMRMTRWMWRWLREPLWLAAAILLFTPTLVDPAREMLAPAIAIAALDVVFKVGDSAWRAAADVSLYGLIAFVAYLVFVALRWLLERWWKQRKAAAAPDERPADFPQAEPTLREILEQERLRPARIEPRL